MLAYDIKELKDGNPWTEAMNLTKLPVFKNKLIYNEFGKLMKLNIGTMEKRAYEVAEFLNIDTKKHKIEIHPNEAEVYLKSDKYEICVNSDVKTTVKFVKPFELPKDLRIKQDSEVTYEKLLKSAEYIKTKYKDIIPMENSKVKVIFGDYSYNREHISWSTCLYSDRDKDVDKIINYTFNNVDIVYDENGNFSDMIIYKPDLSDKLGDYPIITKKNAEEILCSGKYINMGEAKFPGKEYIRKTELVYRYGKEDHYMPYYRIYVEIPTEKQGNNLNCYEAFYVPAVEHSYIYDMDVWKGWYN